MLLVANSFVFCEMFKQVKHQQMEDHTYYLAQENQREQQSAVKTRRSNRLASYPYVVNLVLGCRTVNKHTNTVDNNDIYYEL